MIPSTTTDQIQAIVKNLHGLNYRSMGELATGTPDPMRYLVDGLMPEGVYALLAAPPNAGKSFISLQMAVAIATGRPFLGRETGMPRGVVYLSLEDGMEEVHRRMGSIVAHLRASGEWTEENSKQLWKNAFVLAPDWSGYEEVQAGNGGGGLERQTLAHLAPGIRAFLKGLSEFGTAPGLLIVDTFAAASAGDENQVRDTSVFSRAGLQIAHETGFTVLALHHAAKGQTGARTQTRLSLDDALSIDWIRGSSNISSSPRAILQLAPLRPDQATQANLDPEKARKGGYLALGLTKLSGGPKGTRLILEQEDGEPFAGVWSLMDTSDEVLMSLQGGGLRAKSKDSMDTLLEAIAAAGENPDRVALADQCCPKAKDSKGAFRTLLKKARDSGLVESTEHSICLTAKGRERVKATLASVSKEDDDA